jgi:flagellar hook-associated protein 1
MGNISTALFTSANALNVLGQAFNVVENNISNANTPEFAAQTASFDAQPFDISQQLTGGVEAGPLISSRDEYLEQAVRTQQTSLSFSTQTANDLGQVQSNFSLTSTTSIDTELDNFFNSFSQLAVNPNDTPDRQAVLNAATTMAQSFQSAASSIQQVSTNVTSQTTGAVSQINALASQIANLNETFGTSPGSNEDPGLDAQLHSDLLNLSQLTNYTMTQNNDGGYNIFIGGQSPLVMGGNAYSISSGNTSDQTTIFDSQNNDITSEITGGQLGALVQEQNTTLPGYTSSLNTLAQNFADTVNGQLSQGVDENGDTPTTPLFSYDSGAPASTISVNDLTPDQIAAAAADAPGGGDNATAMAQIANTPEINGATFVQYYSQLATQIGGDVSNAQADQQQSQAQLTQAQTAVSNVSGVNLNTEATTLLQYQQSYQAIGQMVGVLDNLTQTLINMVDASVTE